MTAVLPCGYNANVTFIGIRISLYNAITEEQTDKLVAYIREFVAQEPGVQTLPAATSE